MSGRVALDDYWVGSGRLSLGAGMMLTITTWALMVGAISVARPKLLYTDTTGRPERGRRRIVIAWLRHADDLMFLKRVGGGYIFAHRRLMDYFVERESSARSDGVE